MIAILSILGTAAAVAGLLWFFTPPFLAGMKSTILHVAIFLIAAFLAGTYAYHDGFSAGYAAAIRKIAAEDQDAIDRVRSGAADIRTCREGGGTWDVVSGSCQR